MALAPRNFRVKLPSWLMPALAYAISIGSLIWVLEGVNFRSVAHDFQTLRWDWVTLAIASDISVYIYQAWRWNLLLQPVVRPGMWRSVRAIYVGLLANEVFPFRPGEIIRSYLQARWSAIPFSVAFSSAIIERIFDGIWLMLVFLGTTLLIPLPRVVIDLGKVVGGIVIIFAIALALVMFSRHHAHAAVRETRWAVHLRVLIDDLHLMGSSRSFYAAFAASLPYLLIQVIPIYALIRSYDLELTLWPSFVVLVILRVGTVLPQAPGNVGATQVLIVLALRLFGVSKTTATGLSLVTWGVITLPLLVGGLIALASTGVNLHEIRRHARRHAEQRAARGSQPAASTKMEK
jgi:uncharacterized protein (TIRG00374 family)